MQVFHWSIKIRQNSPVILPKVQSVQQSRTFTPKHSNASMNSDNLQSCMQFSVQTFNLFALYYQYNTMITVLAFDRHLIRPDMPWLKPTTAKVRPQVGSSKYSENSWATIQYELREKWLRQHLGSKIINRPIMYSRHLTSEWQLSEPLSPQMWQVGSRYPFAFHVQHKCLKPHFSETSQTRERLLLLLPLTLESQLKCPVARG